MKVLLAVLLCTLSLLLAGCASAGQGAEIQELPATSHFYMDECFGALTAADFPEVLLAPPVPAGWENDGNIQAVAFALLLSCQRVSVGSFERGPLNLLVEFHSDFSVPDACQDNTYSNLAVLNSVRIPDADVAEHLRSTWQIPAYVGDVSVERSGSMFSTHTWRWGSGDQASEVSFYRADGPSGPNSMTLRLVWPFNGEGMGYIDLNLDSVQTNLEPAFTPGRMRAPMLYSSINDQVYLGLGQIEDSLSPRGEFETMEEATCESN